MPPDGATIVMSCRILHQAEALCVCNYLLCHGSCHSCCTCVHCRRRALPRASECLDCRSISVYPTLLYVYDIFFDDMRSRRINYTVRVAFFYARVNIPEDDVDARNAEDLNGRFAEDTGTIQIHELYV